MAVFENCYVLLELKTLPVKEKTKLKSAITENGGSISFVVNKQCSLIVTSDVSNLSSNRRRCIQKHQTPVVGVDYVHRCLERGVLLPVDGYKLDASSPPDVSTPLPPSSSSLWQSPLSLQAPTSKAATEPIKGPTKTVDSVNLTPETSGNILDKFRIYTETDSDLPTYPDNFQVAKYSIFEKINSSAWCVLELQSYRGEKEWRYCVVRYWKDNISSKKAAVRDMLVFLSTSEDALEVYKTLRETLQSSGLQLRSSIPPQVQVLGSGPLQQLLLEEKLNTGSLSQEVGVFVELLWTEALGRLGNILRVPINKLSLNDVSRVEGLLLQAQKQLKEANYTEVKSLLDEVYTLLPHTETPQSPPSTRLISQKLDLCQLIRDVLNVSEMTLRSPAPSCVGKYRALRCSIEAVQLGTAEFRTVTALLQDSGIRVGQVLSVSRGVELQTFKSEVGNIKTLLHSSSPSNFVGVLSRGLLLPRVGVEHHGIERTDVGNLGSGIYFSDAARTSLKYSKPSETDGSRLLLVCDVALGRCKDVHKKDLTLTQAPEGHHSVHGVRRTPNTPSEFEDDEYVVYSPDQVKLKYVVQFTVKGDQLKEFSPAVDTSAELSVISSDQDVELPLENEGLEDIKNPLEDVTPGLLDSSGQQLPLQAVHVKCKLMDLLSQVIIFQKYTNLSSVPIEAKYVFPLDDSAAVCGFEAFINGKHVVGQVKEKETARKEYKQAIQKGHGAYLMDQDAPDVFTISVGNLPPGATVLIKVTFVSELIVSDGRILFSLPGSVAPWQESAALNQTTQVTVQKVCVTDAAREFTLDMSVEMPYEITKLQCTTHKVKIKRTDCKAVVSVLPGEVMGQEGFQLSVTLSEIHLPRMWVEKHPDKDSQASMLVFYPDYEVSSTSACNEVILLLDTSESMKGESLRTARRIARQVLSTLRIHLRVNVIFFGTDHKEAFLTAQQALSEGYAAAEDFINLSSPVGGSTELWRPLRALSLLPPSSGIRNLLLLSDGHIQNAELTLKLLRDNSQHSRLFTCGLSPTANRHMLRSLAQAGGGVFEFFDIKTKHTWAEKVQRQVKRMESPGCSSVSIKWQQFNPTAPPPVQAPRQLHALFNDCHTLVYGFVPHCTQATLLGNLSGQEFKTMVSTSELQKTRGTFLHKLTARALIRDYEEGSLDANEAEHEGKKAELKHFIIELSKEFSILSQFTSFVAIEERDSEQPEEGFTDIPKLIAEEDVDFLPYISWTSPQDREDEMLEEDQENFQEEDQEEGICKALVLMERIDDDEEESDEDMGFGLMDEEWREVSDYKMSSGSSEDDEEWSGEYDDDMGFGLPEEDEEKKREREDYISFRKMLQGSTSPPTSASVDVEQLEVRRVLRGKSRSFEEQQSAIEEEFDLPVVASCGVPPPPPPPPSFQALHEPYQVLGRVKPRMESPAPPPPPPPPQISAPLVLPPIPHVIRAAHPPKGISPQSFEICSDLVTTLKRRTMFGAGSSNMLTERATEASSGVMLSNTAETLATSSVSVDVKQRSGLVFRGFRPQDQQITQDVCFEMEKVPPKGDAAPLLSGFAFGGSRPQVQQITQAYFEGMEEVPPKDAVAPLQSGFSYSASLPQVQLHPQSCAYSMPLDEAADLRVRPMSDAAAEESVAVKRKKVLPMLRRAAIKKPLPVHQTLKRKSTDPEAPKLRWTKIFQMQHSEGYWELTTELGELVNVDVDLFANVFLKGKGIRSLGVRAHEEILRLLATLLVLQLMRLEKLEEGKLLRTLFSLDDSALPRPERWEEVKRAVDWVCWADQQYPCIYSRLEFGLSWESSTRQLLGFEGFPPLSPLTDLNLQRAAVHLVVH